MGRNPKFEIRLTEEQRARLEDIARNGKGKAKRILHARILLMADEDRPQGRWHDLEIAKALGTHRNTVQRVRKRFILEGEDPALSRKPRERPPVEPKLDGEKEAMLVAICCSPPPAGQARWTLSLLVGELTRRKVVTSICRETVRHALKKTNLSLGGKKVTASPRRITRGSSRRWKTCSMCTPRRPIRRSR